MRRELDDRQGIVDSLFFLGVLAQTRGDWRKARVLIEKVAVLASDIDESLYQHWAARGLEIVESMERTSPDPDRGTSNSPDPVNPFTFMLAAIIYNLGFQSNSAVNGQQFYRLLELASTEEEKAVCLPHIALFLSEEGDPHRATTLLAMAFRYDHIAQGWIGDLPEIAALRRKLSEQISPDDFDRLWAEGQKMDIHELAEETKNRLAAVYIPGRSPGDFRVLDKDGR